LSKEIEGEAHLEDFGGRNVFKCSCFLLAEKGEKISDLKWHGLKVFVQYCRYVTDLKLIKLKIQFIICAGPI
jgi:hypothetical protein